MTDEKVVTVTVRMSPEEHALMKVAAELDSRSLNAYIVHNIIRHARALLKKTLRTDEKEVA